MFATWAAFALLVAFLYLLDRRRDAGLPPGPPRVPFVGNLLQLPQKDPWRVYQQWSKIYGPIFSMRLGLNTVIMLGNAQAADDLLNKRSNIYSSRPRTVMGGEIVSKGFRTLLQPYGPKWRDHQRIHGAVLNISESKKYTVLQDIESKQLMFDMLSATPKSFVEIFHRYAASLIYALAYGKRLERTGEPEAEEINTVMGAFLTAARPGTWIVDALPILNKLPDWLAPWKAYGEKLHNFESKIYMKNLDRGLNSSQTWNWSKEAMALKQAQHMSEKEMSYIIGVIYEAGSDTTAMSLEVFVLAAVKYPEIVKKAQKEIDEAMSSDAHQLPTFEDVEQLPYLQAVVKEVLRWRPVSAGGIPHALTQDDEYLGYKIPAGATIIGNHWSIHLDDQVYKEPYRFYPDRWISDPGLPLMPFGFGRRICTGQHIAKNSLTINIARLLWGYDFGLATDKTTGKTIEVDEMAMTQGFNSRPMPFMASITPRCQEKRKIIEAGWASAEKDIDVILDKIKATSRPA